MNMRESLWEENQIPKQTAKTEENPTQSTRQEHRAKCPQVKSGMIANHKQDLCLLL